MLKEIFERLALGSDFAAIEVAEDIESITSRAGTAADGTVFVVPHRELAAQQRYATGGHTQVIRVQFFAVLLFRQHDDPRGAQRALRFDAMRSAVEVLLAGWVPPGGADPCSLVSGEASGLANGVSIYVQTWQSSRILLGATQ